MKTGGKADRLSYFEWSSEAFYAFYRTLVAYPFPIAVKKDKKKKKKDDPRERWPVFNSLEEWQAQPGAKLGELIQLCLRVLADDKAGLFTITPDGSIEWPPVSENPEQTRKVLIYHEWPMMASTITSAFNVHGLFPYVINGTQTLKERNETLRAFISNEDPKRRILLFSKVGAVGLNLACADVVILYDIVWSDVEFIQIIGRAHRFGQMRTVYVYSMLALGTTDVMMSSNAKFKDDMLSFLVTKQAKESPKEQQDAEADLERMVSGDMAKDSDDDLDKLRVGGESGSDDEEALKPAKKTRRAPKKKAAVAKKDGEQEKDTVKVKKPRGRKKKAVKDDEAEKGDEPPAEDDSTEPAEPSTSTTKEGPPAPESRSTTPTPPLPEPKPSTPPPSQPSQTSTQGDAIQLPSPQAPIPPSTTTSPSDQVAKLSSETSESQESAPAATKDGENAPALPDATPPQSSPPVQRNPSPRPSSPKLPEAVTSADAEMEESAKDNGAPMDVDPPTPPPAYQDVDSGDFNDGGAMDGGDEMNFDDHDEIPDAERPPSTPARQVIPLRRSSRTPLTPSRSDIESPPVRRSVPPTNRRIRPPNPVFADDVGPKSTSFPSILCKRAIGIVGDDGSSNKRRSVSREASVASTSREGSVAPNEGSSRASSAAPDGSQKTAKKYGSLKGAMKPRK